MKLATLIDSYFQTQFLCSMWCCLMALYTHLSKLNSILSNPSTALSNRFMQYSKFFVVFSRLLTSSLPGVNSVSRNHFLCSSIRSNSSFISYIMRLSQFSYIFRIHLFLLLVLPHLQLLSPLMVLIPQSHWWGLELTSSKLLLILIFEPLPINHGYPSWSIEWWILSKMFSINFAQIHQRKYYP